MDEFGKGFKFGLGMILAKVFIYIIIIMIIACVLKLNDISIFPDNNKKSNYPYSSFYN